MEFKHLTQAQIATATFPYIKSDLNWTLDSLERVGVPTIEFQGIDPIMNLDDITPQEMRAMHKKLKDHHLQPICVTPNSAVYPVNLAAANQAVRNRTLRFMKRGLDCANAFECPTVQFHVGFTLVDDSWEEAWKRSRDSLRELAEYAAEKGVLITSEYSAIGWKSVMSSSAELRRMIDEVNHPNYRGLSDTVVMMKIPETIDDVAANLGGEYLKHFHFADGMNNMTSSLHMIPGEGKLDLDKVLKGLDDMKYTGYLSLELQGCETWPEEAMRRGVAWLRERLPE